MAMMIDIKLSEIDEFLAERVLEDSRALRLSLSLEDTDGNIRIKEHGFEDVEFGEGIDFELSTSECRGSEDIEAADLEGMTVHTSSAYGFFEYYLDTMGSADCYIDFRDSAWVIKLY